MIDAARVTIGSYPAAASVCWRITGHGRRLLEWEQGAGQVDQRERGPIADGVQQGRGTRPRRFRLDLWLVPPLGAIPSHRCSGSYNIDGTSWRSFKDYSGGA